MKVLIIIPAYNEEQNIEKTVNDVKTNTNYDYVVINDCSKDKTKEVCEKNNFNMLSLPINYGLTSGIQLGMKYAYKNNYDILQVGTGDSPLTVPFYKKCGFTESHRIKNFFTENYNHPIYECGILLKDMVYFKLNLKNMEE